MLFNYIKNYFNIIYIILIKKLYFTFNELLINSIKLMRN